MPYGPNQIFNPSGSGISLSPLRYGMCVGVFTLFFGWYCRYLRSCRFDCRLYPILYFVLDGSCLAADDLLEVCLCTSCQLRDLGDGVVADPCLRDLR